MNAVSQFTEELRKSTETLRRFVSELRLLKRRELSREAYVKRLSRLNSEVPELKSTLDALFENFISSTKALTESFMILNEKSQSAVVNAIEDHSENARIILSSGETARVELDLFHKPAYRAPELTGESAEPTIREVENLVDSIDLSFLSKMEE